MSGWERSDHHLFRLLLVRYEENEWSSTSSGGCFVEGNIFIEYLIYPLGENNNNNDFEGVFGYLFFPEGGIIYFGMMFFIFQGF